MATILRSVREESGLNQRELAEKVHMPQSLICDLELGKRKPWPNAIKKISAVLGVSGAYIFPNG